MSEALARRQMDRQSILQQRVVLPSGRVVSKEEGRALAKKQDESSNAKPSTSATPTAAASDNRTIVLESDVSKKIVALRQKHNERQNLAANIEAFREDRRVADLVDTSGVRKAASQLYAKNHTDFEKVRNDRARRAINGVPKGKRNAKK